MISTDMKPGFGSKTIPSRAAGQIPVSLAGYFPPDRRVSSSEGYLSKFSDEQLEWSLS
jgi:hypothetical protein